MLHIRDVLVMPMVIGLCLLDLGQRRWIFSMFCLRLWNVDGEIERWEG